MYENITVPLMPYIPLNYQRRNSLIIAVLKEVSHLQVCMYCPYMSVPVCITFFGLCSGFSSTACGIK